ncbi:low specificity phosphatase HAD superfamily [Serpentinimonas raichei]|uniref:3-deoxy-D-manno-octulosonate 8-phosphate phosphatase KdsC n=1 Tax=Serpentinimonas raichei TaxID=1458425 RepID=A0A060NI36_9BURK|nr:HAD hydrolase family protein [Serpentinimonas raichei]BAO81701.1 low specificity phosphatase HAD superfamily [Serpentinimonas raichei]
MPSPPDTLRPPPSTPLGAPALPALLPTLGFDPALLLRAQGIRVVLFDIDGVLTDAGLYFSEAGETLKRFHSLDGHGIKLLQRAGIVVAVVSGRDSAPLRTRLQALGVTHLRLGHENKRPAAEALLAELGLGWHEAAAMGDDWPDLPLLRRCALAVAPPNAHPEVLRLAHHVTTRPGGQGAARELCDLLLVASGQYARLLQEAGA